jgi:hypothetical protein
MSSHLHVNSGYRSITTSEPSPLMASFNDNVYSKKRGNEIGIQNLELIDEAPSMASES